MNQKIFDCLKENEINLSGNCQRVHKNAGMKKMGFSNQKSRVSLEENTMLVMNYALLFLGHENVK